MGYVVVVGIGGRRVFDQRDIQATGIYRCVGMGRVWGRGGVVILLAQGCRYLHHP